MTDLEPTVDRYIAIWNESDAGRRGELIARTWTEDAAYLDPLMSGDGHDGLDAMIAAAQAQVPAGCRFRRTGAVDAHHDRVRFGWELVGPDGAMLAVGLDFGEVAADGRLRRVTGFLPEPAGAATP